MIRKFSLKNGWELCYDYLAPNDSAMGRPLDRAGDRVARDRRILMSKRMEGSGRGLPLLQAFRSQGMTRELTKVSP